MNEKVIDSLVEQINSVITELNAHASVVVKGQVDTMPTLPELTVDKTKSVVRHGDDVFVIVTGCLPEYLEVKLDRFKIFLKLAESAETLSKEQAFSLIKEQNGLAILSQQYIEEYYVSGQESIPHA